MGQVAILAETEDLDVFDFGEALRRLRKTARVSRGAWRTNGKWVEMYFPPGSELPTLLFCQLGGRGPSVSRVTYVPEQIDILSDDWQEA